VGTLKRPEYPKHIHPDWPDTSRFIVVNDEKEEKRVLAELKKEKKAREKETV